LFIGTFLTVVIVLVVAAEVDNLANY